MHESWQPDEVMDSVKAKLIHRGTQFQIGSHSFIQQITYLMPILFCTLSGIQQ